MEFVTFQEAMNATTEGKTVCSWLEDESKPYNIHYQEYDKLSNSVKLDRFVLMGEEIARFDKLKWTIGTNK